MVSLQKIGRATYSNTLELVGLSTDIKPVVTFNNKKITNGSTYYCMDNGDIFMYDETNETWLAQ